jgi:hypothetical protein
VRAGDVADGVDHRHDHEAEGERDPDLAEGLGLRIDHDGATTREHERKGADELGTEPAHGSQVEAQLVEARSAGSSSSMSF